MVSDWGATHAGVAPILAGLDMDMPGGIAFTETAHSFFGGNLTAAVNNGSVPIERVDDMVRERRIQPNLVVKVSTPVLAFQWQGEQYGL